MSEEQLTNRLNIRVQAIVVRGQKILMARHRVKTQEYWCLPGGGLEEGETLEEGVLRELQEECRVSGHVLRLTSHLIDAEGVELITYLVEIGDQDPTLGSDPDASPDSPLLIDIQWLALNELPERDRAFLWQAGLMTVPEFLGVVEGWGDDISCPECIG